MSLFSSLFGRSKKQSIGPDDDYTLASGIASAIDRVISMHGFSELERPNTAIVMSDRNRISMVWSSDLQRGGDIKSFVYLKDVPGSGQLKSSFGFDIAKDMQPQEAKELIQMMGETLGQPAIDKLAIAALHQLKSTSE